MKKKVLLGIAIGCIILILLFFSLTVPRKKELAKIKNAGPSPTPIESTILTFSPKNVTFDVNGNASVNILINTGYNHVTGIQLELGYDPEVISNLKVEPGSFLASPIVLLENKAVSGRYSYMLGIPPSKDPASGKGIVATVRFQQNLLNHTKNQTTLTIMPKSLVTSLGVEGSVLKKSDSITMTVPIPTQTTTGPTQTSISPTNKP